MRQVPLVHDINIDVNGCSGFASSTQKGPFMGMLISRSRGTCLIILPQRADDRGKGKLKFQEMDEDRGVVSAWAWASKLDYLHSVKYEYLSFTNFSQLSHFHTEIGFSYTGLVKVILAQISP